MIQHTNFLGPEPWTRDEIIASIPEFLALYNKKPISNNQGGMKLPHLFATWFMVKKLNPEHIIESGVWKGQGTWLLENTCPNAKLHCIDIKLAHREYISEKANYYQQDFNTIDWSDIENPGKTLLFFDDHQDAVERVRQATELGFKHLIFEDNYPAIQGDCYSLKKAFMHAGFEAERRKPNSLRSWLAYFLKPQRAKKIEPNDSDEKELLELLDIYYEFPPVYQSEMTRWNDAWTPDNYPTPAPLFSQTNPAEYPQFLEECIYYTWICYARLK